MKRSAAAIRKFISEQEASGQSVPSFCRERGINEATFYSWRTRKPEGGARFTRVLTERRIELELSSGITIRIAPQDLKAVLEAL